MYTGRLPLDSTYGKLIDQRHLQDSARTKSAFHLSELTGPGELVLPGPNEKAVASLRDYARDMTCLRGQLRVFRNVNEQTWRMCCLS